jgi:hypothetical protein
MCRKIDVTSMLVLTFSKLSSSLCPQDLCMCCFCLACYHLPCRFLPSLSSLSSGWTPLGHRYTELGRLPAYSTFFATYVFYCINFFSSHCDRIPAGHKYFVSCFQRVQSMAVWPVALGRAQWWQDHVAEDLLHLMVDRRH